MFLVEIRGDDEQPIFVETIERLIENPGPNWFVIPEILMPQKGDVRGADLL